MFEYKNDIAGSSIKSEVNSVWFTFVIEYSKSRSQSEMIWGRDYSILGNGCSV